ncbi:NAD(+) salvage pathway protein [Xylographa bjoerkii]|nr:NAD(+) salvage pathway protein [Xylographa bjoerkii]
MQDRDTDPGHRIEQTVFSCKRLNLSTYLIVENDRYQEHPFIYAKVVQSPSLLLLSDTGCGGGENSAPGLPSDTLRNFLETFPIADNGGKPLNPRKLNGKPTLSYLIICTHCHYDHILGIPSFQEVSPVILASSNEKSFIEDDLPKHSLCSDLDVPTPEYVISYWAADMEKITYNNSPLGVQILHTPGHTPDELAWYDEAEHHLFVGDSFYERVATDNSYTQAIIFPREGDIIVYMQSLEKLLSFVQQENRLHRFSDVRIGCGHITSSVDALGILKEVQRYFWDVIDGIIPNGSLAIAGGRELAPIINDLLTESFVLKVATKDFHPPDHVSFDTSHPPPNNKAFESTVKVANPTNPTEAKDLVLWPVHCVQGTPGAEIIEQIDATAIDVIVEKGKDKRVEMYSGFADMFGNKSEAASLDLAALMSGKGVTHVYMVGLAGDHCVKCTAIDAKLEGFETYVIREGTRSVDEGEAGWCAAVKEFQKCGIKVVSINGPELARVKAVTRTRYGRDAHAIIIVVVSQDPFRVNLHCSTSRQYPQPHNDVFAALHHCAFINMVSSKGKPKDPKLREEIKEKVKGEMNKDGGGSGQWSAWKANKLAKEYEKEGGTYENEAGSKNEPEKGVPEQKSESKKEKEVKAAKEDVAEGKEDLEEEPKGEAEKPKANSGKKATGKKADTKAKTTRSKKEKKPPTEGTRKSSRVSTKRSAPVDDEEESEPEKKAPAKKSKSAKN